MTETTLRKGDLYRHPSYPGWIWEFLREHNNPRVGVWTLVLELPGAKWPRESDIPKIGDLRELGYSTLDPVNEMEVIALMAQR